MHSPNVRFVVVRPRSAENLGAAARALKNFGVRDWAWVDPVADVSPGGLAAARRLAVHAGDLLDDASTVATLDEAVADCVWVVGTTGLASPGRRRLSPRELAEEMHRRARSDRCALVFGDVRDGLRQAELWHCHDVSTIRADVDQPSLNVAQAMLLYAYELHEAARRARPAPSERAPIPADDATLARVEAVLRRALTVRGLLDDGERHIVRDLFGTIRRSRLSRREAELWLTALHLLAKEPPSSDG